jgi:hypothetical protein
MECTRQDLAPVMMYSIKEIDPPGTHKNLQEVRRAA